MFTQIFRVAAAMALLGTVARSHMCLVSPMQRGPLPQLLAGYDSACGHGSPKSNYSAGKPVAIYKAGVPATMLFQQNINHWKPGNAGYFDAQVSYDGEKTWENISGQVSDFPSNWGNTQTFMTMTVVFPKVAEAAAVRARYVTNNVEGIFYQFSDVKVIEPSMAIKSSLNSNALPTSLIKKFMPTMETPTKPRSSSGEFSCMSPKKFVAKGIKISYGKAEEKLLSNITISYDGTMGMLRHDEEFMDAKTMKTMTVSHVTEPLKLVEYQWAIGSTDDKCMCEKGIDALANPPYQFGEQVGMQFEGKSAGAANFGIPSANIWYGVIVSKDGTCTPQYIQHGTTLTYFKESQPVSNFPTDTFTLPTTCKKC